MVERSAWPCRLLGAGDLAGPGGDQSCYARQSGTLALLAALAAALSAQAQQKDKDKAKTKDKDAKPATTELTAKLVKVDEAKSSITVDDGGKKRDFSVTDDTKIVGPRGGVSKNRLKDDRFVPGWEMKLTIAADGKKLTHIQLPIRKSEKPDETKKSDKKAADKK